jgi:O-antigen/teichoic acid export membrane protein
VNNRPKADAGSDRSDTQATIAHFSGSVLLLCGRGLSLVLNLVVHVLIVRYLSKLEYGAFAYALAIVSICSSVIVFGLDKAASRFFPIYEERAQYEQLSGAIVLTFSTVSGIGIAVVLAVLAAAGPLSEHVVNDPLSLTLLLLLIAMAPMTAIDALLVSIFAAFANPWAIFWRRHVLGPGLKIVAILVTIASHESVSFLAVGYLVAAVVGIVVNCVVLYRILRAKRFLGGVSLATVRNTARELYRFSATHLFMNIATLMRGTLAVVILEYFNGAAAVAEFRSVLPLARLNEAVLVSFSFLFVPLASRRFARQDSDKINELYWQSTAWVAVLSFPLFLASFCFAEPLTRFLFGNRYEGSAMVLKYLAVGFFVYTLFGFANRVLSVYGKLWHLVASDVIAILVAGCLYWLLVPSHGALGAAIGACVAMIVHALVNQALLYQVAGVRFFQARYTMLYVLIGIISFVLYQLQSAYSIGLAAGAPMVLFTWLLFLVLNRRLLDVGNTFPGLRRLPMLRLIFDRDG